MNRGTTISAPSTALTTERIIAQAAIGQLALDHHRALVAADSAKRIYHDAIRTFECGEGQIRPDSPGWDDLKAETAPQYANYQAAKRAAYNIKRRLSNACRKVAP